MVVPDSTEVESTFCMTTAAQRSAAQRSFDFSRSQLSPNTPPLIRLKSKLHFHH